LVKFERVGHDIVVSVLLLGLTHFLFGGDILAIIYDLVGLIGFIFVVDNFLLLIVVLLHLEELFLLLQDLGLLLFDFLLGRNLLQTVLFVVGLTRFLLLLLCLLVIVGVLIFLLTLIRFLIFIFLLGLFVFLFLLFLLLVSLFLGLLFLFLVRFLLERSVAQFLNCIDCLFDFGVFFVVMLAMLFFLRFVFVNQ
jgi:hypothetical protein